MSIDPLRLVAQQRAAAAQRETKCDRCGRRTRDVSGTCSTCRRSIPDLSKLTTAQVVGLIDSCRTELERRRDEATAALRGTP